MGTELDAVRLEFEWVVEVGGFEVASGLNEEFDSVEEVDKGCAEGCVASVLVDVDEFVADGAVVVHGLLGEDDGAAAGEGELVPWEGGGDEDVGAYCPDGWVGVWGGAV